jgi:hypothetical protein
LSISFSIESFKSGYSSLSIGNIPAYINGTTSEKPSIATAFSAFSLGHSIFSGFHKVSHTFASLIDLRPVTTYHIEPLDIFLSLIYFGEKYHTSSASIFFFELRNVSVSHFFISHANTFT